MTPFPGLAFSDTGEVLVPMQIMEGCCGGVFCRLTLQDAAGNSPFCLYTDDIIPESRLDEWRNNKTGRPELVLPDSEYEQYLNLPSVQQAMTSDQAFQQKLEQQHADE